MKRTFLFLFLLMFPLFAACTAKELRVEQRQVSADTPNPAKPPEEFYKIGPGDSLEIVLWKEPTLSGPVVVRPDGFVSLPLVNEVQVVGLTTAQVRDLLQEKYKEFIKSPFVTIRIAGIASSEIFLVGEVNSPGAFRATGNDTILQVLTRAGGLSPFADRDSIRVMRREGDKVTEYIVDYDAILKGDLKQDILLRPGDRIIVS
jgi:polysaccharide export outer membrane protein